MAKESCSVVFCDIVIAFAVIVCRIIFTADDCDESWLKKLRIAGFPASDIEAIISFLRDSQWLFGESSTPEDSLIIKIASAFYKSIWFSQTSAPQCVKTSFGSMAGVPLADLVFALTFSRILRVLMDAIRDAELTSYVMFGVQGLNCLKQHIVMTLQSQ